MQIAIVDLGTNSVRFDIHQLRANKKTHQLYHKKIMIKLGDKVFTTGRLDTKAMQRTVRVFRNFKKTCLKFHVKKVIAVGTSALREAKNSYQLISRIKKQTGISIRIISGSQEAKLIANGILAHEIIRRQNFGHIDIGGGSIEISLFKDKKLITPKSFPLGVARLQQVFLKTIPPSQEDILKLQLYVYSTIKSSFISTKYSNSLVFLGSSGTIRSLAKLTRRQTRLKFLTPEALRDLIYILSSLSKKQILKLDGIDPSRTEMILAGALLLEASMLALNAKQVIPIHSALREGLLEHYSAK
ncbi:MAG: hypothetical protein HY843_03900 [Bdellovibrio sp.]|nr:hypothetical protein [Bdellovibrio sp.]